MATAHGVVKQAHASNELGGLAFTIFAPRVRASLYAARYTYPAHAVTFARRRTAVMRLHRAIAAAGATVAALAAAKDAPFFRITKDASPLSASSDTSVFRVLFPNGSNATYAHSGQLLPSVNAAPHDAGVVVVPKSGPAAEREPFFFERRRTRPCVRRGCCETGVILPAPPATRCAWARG
jgi:hypothetical protein